MTVEKIKRDSDYLRGTLVSELAEKSAAFAEDSTQILKFHGVYQQDDRDRRRGADRDYVMMVRASIPGGVLSAEQYLVADELSDWVGDGTLRITSRQGLQWHQVRKGSLRPMIWTLNQSLVTTFGACGDVVRNVVACPGPSTAGLDLSGWAGRLADRFRPRTNAYYEVWIDGARTVSAEATGDAGTVEPIYGSGYLPRKFKVGIAASGDNCVDVYTHDVGLIAVAESDGSLVGFTVLVGGGQGRSHNQPETYSRLADPLTTVPPADVLDVVETVVTIVRDHGDRTDRKQARLKYLIDRWGPDRFRTEVEKRLGWSLPEAEPVEKMSVRDHFGWHRSDDSWWLGVHVENGRISDAADKRLRTALLAIADRFRPEFRFTPQQNVLLSGFADRDREPVDRILADHGIVPANRLAAVVRDSMACVALPTCALALTDAERALPEVARSIAEVLADIGLDEEEIGLRMTGCPNGCARPYSTEIGLVGHRRGRYDIHLGGARDGTRLNDLFLESVPTGSVAEALRPLLAAFASGREQGETFGDFVHRHGLDWFKAASMAGKTSS